MTTRFAVCLTLLVACGGDDDGGVDAAVDTGAVLDAGTDAPRVDAGPEPLPAIPGRIPDTEATEGRASCRYARGAMPWETLGESQPLGDAIPIDHVLVLVQENRSFDHYFGAMEGVDGIAPEHTNPDASGADVAPFHTDEYCIEDVAHSWTAVWNQYADGAMSGFVQTSEPEGARAMGYLTEADLPFYYALYRTFAMSDRHFCSMLGPTWPNRYFLTSATSFGRIRNDTIDEDAREGDYVLFQQLDARRLGWRVYQSDLPTPIGLYPQYAGRRLSRIQPMDRFFDDVAAGDLPAVTFLEPQFFQGVDQTDEHPPANPQRGQAFVHRVVEALTQSPLWSRSALVITYDEHGGFWDHVPPPEACPPDALAPELRPTDAPGGFDRLGVRVPLVVVSPYAKANYVSHEVTDLTSVLRLVQTRWLLPALSARDANAWPMLDLFDFEAPPFMEPPRFEAPPVDAAQVDACRAAFPGGGI